MVDFLQSLDQFISEPTKELAATVADGEQICEDVSNGLSDVELRGLQIGFGIPLTIISFTMLLLAGATAMGMGNNSTRKDCLTSWFVMPLFIFILLFMVIMTMGFSIGGIVNADFCSGGASVTPDETLIEIMNKKGIPPETVKYQVVSYVVNGCDFESPQNENPLIAYEAFDQELEAVTAEIKSFTERIQNIDAEQIAKQLGRSLQEIGSMKEKADTLESRVRKLFNTLDQVLTDLACARLVILVSLVLQSLYETFLTFPYCFRVDIVK